VGVAVVLAAGASLAALRISLNSSLIALLPEDAQSVRSLRRVVEKTGGLGDLMVMIESSDLDASLTYAAHLLPQVRSLPWVQRAAIGRDRAFFERHALLYMKRLELQDVAEKVRERIRQEKLRRNPFYVDLEAPAESGGIDLAELRERHDAGIDSQYYTSQDEKILIMVIQPQGVTSDMSFVRRAHAKIEALVKAQPPGDYDANMRVSVGGTFKNRLDEYDTVIRDVTSSSVIVGIALVVLLALYFRHPVAVPVLALPLAVALAWTFAVAQLVVGS
jgi:predicted RND superfamily exporter protein